MGVSLFGKPEQTRKHVAMSTPPPRKPRGTARFGDAFFQRDDFSMQAASGGGVASAVVMVFVP